MKKLFLAVFFLFLLISSKAQEYKSLAIDEFKKEHYQEAIRLLQKSLKQNPQDPEVYYYLGVFTHYQCYDSAPLTNINKNLSDSVLVFLKKAIELRPDYGDAYYFIGAEHGARALSHIQDKNPEAVRKEYLLSREDGGLPDWLLEYARNTLNSCETNAILFTGGDPEYNPAVYLQTAEKYRTDITVIPFALLERPWFISYLKNGLNGILNPVKITLSDKQIADLHPYKWKNAVIELSVPPHLKEQYKLNEQVFRWELKPDLKRDERELLGVHGAMLLNILQSNNWQRPIYFSLGCQEWMFFGLNKNVQLNGMTNKLLPFEIESDKLKINTEPTLNLIKNKNNFSKLGSFITNKMPRISGIIMNYIIVHLRLANHYTELKQSKSAKETLDNLDHNIPPGIFPRNEIIKKEIERIRHQE